MRAVKGTARSWRCLSVPKAAAITARFASAGASTGVRSDVAAYVRLASSAFDELADLHRELRSSHKKHQIEIHGGEAEESPDLDRKRMNKRNPSRQEESDGVGEDERREVERKKEARKEKRKKDKKRSKLEEEEKKNGDNRVSDILGKEKGAKFEVMRNHVEDNGLVERIKKEKDLEDNGIGIKERIKPEDVERSGEGKKKHRKENENRDKEILGIEKGAKSEEMSNHEEDGLGERRKKEKKEEKKKKEKKEKYLEEQVAGDELRVKLEEEEMSSEGKMKHKKKNEDRDKDILGEGKGVEYEEVRSHFEDGGLGESRKKEKKEKRNLEEGGFRVQLDGDGADGDRRKRKHSDNRGVRDEGEWHKKKKKQKMEVQH